MLFYYIAWFIKIFFNLLSFLVIVRSLLSWIPNRPHNALIDFIIDVTNPILDLAKKITPQIGMIDLSPLVAILALDLIATILVKIFNG